MSGFSGPSPATDAQAQAQTAGGVALTPLNLAGRASFSAHKNAINQTAIPKNAFTTIKFSTELWDIGSIFASSACVPPAGKFRFSASVYISSGLDVAGYAILALFKNAARYKDLFVVAGSPAVNAGLGGSCIVDTNGTDSWTLRVILASAADNAVADGAIASTWFDGEQL